MEMEELNKSQIVLLTLLVSFVTSLATGIVTVSLMEQGTTPVTNTVNKIVERTKEIVVRVPETPETVVITETETVLVNQSDLVVSAVSKNKNSSIIIYKVRTITPQEEELSADTPLEEVVVGTTTPESQVAGATVALDDGQDNSDLVFASRAIVLSSGVLVADASTLELDTDYVVLDPNGDRSPVSVQAIGDGLAILKTDIGTAATMADTTDLKRGQATVVLSGIDRPRVVTGIISDILLEGGQVVAIEIDKAINTPGSMLIDIEGNLLGISTGLSRANGATWFTASHVIEAALPKEDLGTES
jgi:hypothetical protein